MSTGFSNLRLITTGLGTLAYLFPSRLVLGSDNLIFTLRTVALSTALD